MLRSGVLILQAELEEVEKQAMQLESLAEATRMEESQQSLHLGQIIMSVDNLFQRCIVKRPTIQHANELDEKGGTVTAIQNADSYVPKVRYAIKQLDVIKAYMKDLRDIADTIKKERKGVNKQAAVEYTNKIAEPEFVVEKGDSTRSPLTK